MPNNNSEVTLPTSTAPATPVGADQPSPLISMAPMVLVFVVFYFLMIRPHQKRLRQHENLLKAIKRGDKVLTGGGIIGTVIKVADGDEMIDVEIASGVTVKVTRASISAIINKNAVAAVDSVSQDSLNKKSGKKKAANDSANSSS